jgi:hypothetical protein
MEMPRKDQGGYYKFPDHEDFRPNMSPKEMFAAGIFGGTYFRPIHSGVTNRNYKDQHEEFPDSWWRGLTDEYLTSTRANIELNKYGVWSGSSLEDWESKGWIVAQDPYGWVQWYCRFFSGRRTRDDKRQIDRWNAIAGPKGRFKVRLDNLVKNKRDSPVIRQLLLQWGLDF